MKTPRGIKIEQKVKQLKKNFERYLWPIFEDWKRVVPGIIRNKIVNPLFKIDNDNKTIGLNFAKEVIMLFL